MIDFKSLLDKETEEKGYGPNKEQREVIFSDKNTIVSAGAGSGKTTVLSYRFLRLVLEGKAKVDEILTLTFTRKAAAEMHTRILKQLLKYKELPVVESQLALFSSASISTLDSFCSQIVKADCLRYGIARDFTLSSENITGDDLVLLLANEIIEDPQYKEPLSLLAQKLSITDLYNSFFLPLSKLCSIITELDVDKEIAMLSALLEKNSNDYYQKAIEAVCYLEKEYYFTLTANGQAAFDSNKAIILNKTLDCSFNGRSNPRKNEDFKFYYDEMKTSYESYKKYQIALNNLPEERIVLNLIEAFILRFQKNKREKGELTFTDISALAVDILKTNKGLRQYFKQKFKYVMIDEFQDNNALQKELLYLLGEACESSLDCIPEAKDLSPSKLFFVGDEKQSIYRFRGADVSVFKALSNEIKECDGNVLTLSANYRSEPLIIKHINSVFHTLFKGDAPFAASAQDALTRFEVQEDATSLPLPEVNERGEIFSSVNLFISSESEEDLEDEEELLDSESEAYFIARKIEEVVKGGKYKVRGKGRDAMRTPTWSDVAILLRSGTNQMNYEKALLSKGIPYTVEESRSLMLEAIASDLYSALQYILYPEDKSAYIALLRSPFVRLKDSSVLALSNGNTELDSVDKEKLSTFLSHIEKARQIAQNNELTALIDYLYYNTGYYSFLLSNPRYHAYLENYDTVWELARDFETEGLSPSRFVSYMRDNMASSNKLNSTPGWKEAQDAVRILTIHKSKGLEYPIVFIANAGANSRGNSSTYPFSSGIGLLSNLPTVNYANLLGEDENEKDKAEMLRLLYVAATRAENHLFISGSLKLKKDGSLSAMGKASLLGQYMIGLGAYDCDDKPTGASLIPIQHYPKLSASELEREEIKSDKQALKEFVQNVQEGDFLPNIPKYNASALETESLDSSNSFMLPSLPCDDVLVKNNLVTDFGTFCHTLCEYAVKGMNLNLQTFNKAVLTDRENELVTECGYELVSSLMENDYFLSLLKRGKAECEVRFFMPFKDSILEGVADLIIVCDDYCLVLDYKTDKEIIKDNHKAQILAYLKAVSELYGGKKTYGSLVYLRSIKKEDFWDIDGNIVAL